MYALSLILLTVVNLTLGGFSTQIYERDGGCIHFYAHMSRFFLRPLSTAISHEVDRVLPFTLYPVIQQGPALSFDHSHTHSAVDPNKHTPVLTITVSISTGDILEHEQHTKPYIR